MCMPACRPIQIRNQVMCAPTESLTDELNSLTECCICFDKYRDPRTLPCIHTFCLQCLKHLTRQNRPGETVRCPLCNQKFTVPLGGIDGLPGNPFVSRILDISKLSRSWSSKRQHGQESTERTKLKRNAERVSCLLADGVRCAQMREKATTSVLAKHEIVKDGIVKKIEELNVLLDELHSLKLQRREKLEDEQEEMEEHLATLASYRNYCRDLAENGTTSEVAQELDTLDKRLQELEEIHETRIRSEFLLQKKLLDEIVLDSVMSNSFLKSTGGNVRDPSDANLLRRRRSESLNGETKEPETKRMRLADFEDGGRLDSPLHSHITDNFDSTHHSEVRNGYDGYNTTASSSAAPHQAAHTGTSSFQTTTPDTGTTSESNIVSEPITSTSIHGAADSGTSSSPTATPDTGTTSESNIVSEPITSTSIHVAADSGTSSSPTAIPDSDTTSESNIVSEPITPSALHGAADSSNSSSPNTASEYDLGTTSESNIVSEHDTSSDSSANSDPWFNSDEDQGNSHPRTNSGEGQRNSDSQTNSDEDQGNSHPRTNSDEDQGNSHPWFNSDDNQGNSDPQTNSDEDQGDSHPRTNSDVDQGNSDPWFNSDEDQGISDPQTDSDEDQSSSEC